MKDVEFIYPYTIVEENGFYGIADCHGNLVVSCIMDEVSNEKYGETGLEQWTDYHCVIIVKDGKFGFFTDCGKFIEPAYESYCVDPCGGSIHVKTDEGFGVFEAPKYVFEKLSAELSLLAEQYPDDL